MLSGAHAPNSGWNLGDYCRFRLGAFRTVKLMSYHTAIDVDILRGLGCEKFLVRLPDSVDEGGRWKGKEEWADECVNTIHKFAPLGIKDYQLDNEPNETWPESEAGTWRWLVSQVVPLIRSSMGVPQDVRLGLAPLSWKPGTWHSVQNVWVPEQRKLINLHQFACVQSYYQKAAHYNSPSFGGNATHWHDVLLPSLPLVITEWGSSIHETGLPASEVEARRLVEYPRWLEWAASKEYIEAAYLYILGGTEDWRGFWPTDKVLRKLPYL